MASAPRNSATPQSQTLDRGLRILEVLADAPTPLAMAQIAEAVGMHRSIAYRLVRTLEAHRLVRRRTDGSYEPGFALAALARSVSRPLQTAALPHLVAAANDLEMTAFLVTADGNECVTLLSVEPHLTATHVAYRPGTRHPIDAGAPGLALLAGAPPIAGERAEVELARERGYAQSMGEVAPGVTSIAVPASVDHERAAIAVVYVAAAGDGGHTPAVPEIAARLRRAAADITHDAVRHL